MSALSLVRARILADCYRAGMSPSEAADYSTALLTYLALDVSNFGNRSSNLVTWEPKGEKPRNTFTRQALGMTWDFCEVNPLGPAGWEKAVKAQAAVMEQAPAGPQPGVVRHQGAQDAWAAAERAVQS